MRTIRNLTMLPLVLMFRSIPSIIERVCYYTSKFINHTYQQKFLAPFSIYWMDASEWNERRRERKER